MYYMKVIEKLKIRNLKIIFDDCEKIGKHPEQIE